MLCDRWTVIEHRAPKAKSPAERQAAPSSPLWVPTFTSGRGETLVKPIHQTMAKTGLSTWEHSLLL